MNLSDWWAELTGGGVFATAASYVAVKVRRIDKLEREKADRAELSRAIEAVEKRIERRDEDARQSRKEMYQKLDRFMENQNKFNQEMARVAGRVNGQN